MVTLIKNQIIKHLSVFAKNLQPDQISLEVLSGTGELRNIVLNEAVLSEKLELPPFLRIKRAECNRVKVNIPWTKIRSSPVKIIIDELTVALELTNDTADESPKKVLSSGSYGFADQVVEGLTLKINVLDISFESKSFSGSLWLSPLVVESRTPVWEETKSLKQTRVADTLCHQVIFHKHVSWNLLKIQAFAHSEGGSDSGKRLNSPLRLITQGGRCRIAIKKDSNNGSVLAARIQTIFDDIHWVATLAELRSAITFYNHILALAKASSQHVEQNPFLVDYSAKSRAQRIAPNPAIKSTIFNQFDIGQTSHHVYINKVHTTLIDDGADEKQYPENWNISSGAIQITLEQIAVDFYLQNLIADERRYWVRYKNQPNNDFMDFANGELQRYRESLSIGMDTNERDRQSRLWSTLTSQSLVVRITDIVVECVSEQSTKRDDLQDMFTSKTNTKCQLPESVPAFHFEFSNYSFPGSSLTAPPSAIAHAVVGPCNLLVDIRTIRWLLYIVDNITRSLEIEDSVDDIPIVCARFEVLIPKIIIPCPPYENDDRYPERFVLNVSTITLSNRVVSGKGFFMTDFFQKLGDENFRFIESFKNQVVQEELRTHVLQSKQLSAELATEGASVDLLPTRWYLSTSPFWVESVLPIRNTPGLKCLNGMTVVSDVMLAGCIEVKGANLLIAVEPLNALTVIVDHFQFIQFMRVQKSIGDLLEQIEADSKFFSEIHNVPAIDTTLLLYLFCNEIDVHVVLPVGWAPSPYDLEGGSHSMSKVDTLTSFSSDTFPDRNIESSLGQNLSPFKRTSSAVNNSAMPATISLTHPVSQAELSDTISTGFSSERLADDSVSNMDESLSVISDDDSHIQFDHTNDDIFPEVAEEALDVEEVQASKRQLKLYETNVNCLSVKLSDFNLIVTNVDKKSIVTGYAGTIQVGESLNVLLKTIHGKPTPFLVHTDEKLCLSTFEDAYLHFQIVSGGQEMDKFVHVIAKLSHLHLSINDQIVSYLGPFISDDTQEEEPVFLELSIENSNIQIIKNKRRNPLRIKVGQLSIVDGEDKLAKS